MCTVVHIYAERRASVAGDTTARARSTESGGTPMSADSKPDVIAAAVAERVDALIADMTPEEKAGQLTQYFYVKLPEGQTRPEPHAEGEQPDFSRHPALVECAMRRRSVSLIFV